MKCMISKIRNSTFKCYAGKGVAISKSHKPDAGHAVGYGYAGKVGAPRKSMIPNAGHAVGDAYAGKSDATGKSKPSDAGHAVGDAYAGKAGALLKSRTPDAGHAGGDAYAGKAAAPPESGIPNAGYAVGDAYRAAYSLWGFYQGSFCLVEQYAAFTCVSRIVSGYRYAGKAGAAPKNLTPNAGHAVGYSNADYFVATESECRVRYSGNGHSFYARGNGDDLFCPHIRGNLHRFAAVQRGKSEITRIVILLCACA